MFTDNHRRYLLNALRHLEQERDEALHHRAGERPGLSAGQPL